MDRFELWRRGGLRGANAFPRHTVQDLSALRSWGANLAAFGVKSVLETEEPFDFQSGAMKRIAAMVCRSLGRRATA